MTAGRILAIDTAGRHALVALGRPDGRLLAESRWEAGYRHGEELLVRVDALLRDAGEDLAGLVGIVVGTGPGAFTGLRVGLATAKALARGLQIPIAGVPTSEALLLAARRGRGADDDAAMALLVPAGPSDRVLVAAGEARLLRAGTDPELDGGTIVVAVDLPERSPAEAQRNGELAEAGLGAALLELGSARLAAGGDEVARLVPEYVSLPRGVGSVGGEVKWSRGRS